MMSEYLVEAQSLFSYVQDEDNKLKMNSALATNEFESINSGSLKKFVTRLAKEVQFDTSKWDGMTAAAFLELSSNMNTYANLSALAISSDSINLHNKFEALNEY